MAYTTAHLSKEHPACHETCLRRRMAQTLQSVYTQKTRLPATCTNDAVAHSNSGMTFGLLGLGLHSLAACKRGIVVVNSSLGGFQKGAQ